MNFIDFIISIFRTQTKTVDLSFKLKPLAKITKNQIKKKIQFYICWLLTLLTEYIIFNKNQI